MLRAPLLPLGDLPDKLRQPLPRATAGAVLHSVAAPFGCMGSLRLSPLFAVNQRKETAMQSIKDTYQRITDTIIEQLEAGTKPWIRPCAEAAAAPSFRATPQAKPIAGPTS